MQNKLTAERIEEAVEWYEQKLMVNEAMGLHGKQDKSATTALAASQRRAQDARNELCQRCGRYKEAHKGACDGCRWKED